MAGKERSFWNWTKNVAKAPWRTLYTWALLFSDAVNTVSWLGEDFFSVIKATKNKIVDCFSPDKKWYKKILNIPVAAGVWLVWAVESIVKPMANWFVNSGKTLLNLGTNTWKSTFGSVFSAKPVSDFSFNTVKTKKWIISIDTEKRRLNPHKLWISKWWAWSSSTISKPAAIAGGVAAAAAVASTAWSKEVAELKNNIKNLNNQIADLQKRLMDALSAKKPEGKVAKDTPTSTTKDTSHEWKPAVTKVKEDDASHETKPVVTKVKEDDASHETKPAVTKAKEDDTSHEAKPAVTKAKEDDKGKSGKEWTKLKEEKTEKWEWKWWKADDAKEKADDKKWKESLDTEAKRKWLEEANDLLKDSPCGQKIIAWLCKKYENFWIIFDDTTCEWHHNTDSITVWTKMPKDKDHAALAPFNRDVKDKRYQTRHVLLHELAHCTVASHADSIPEIKKWLGIIKKYIDKNTEWRTLSALTYNNNVYKTTEAKAKEDLVEMFALRMNWNGTSCQKYLKLLSSDEDKELREKYGLVTVSKDDADELQKVCDAMAKYYK